MGRRAKTPFTLYFRETGYWWVQFRIKKQRFRKSTEATTRGEAESRAAAIWQEAKARAGEPAPGRVSRPLKGLAADLLIRVKGLGRAPTYFRDLDVDLRIHILPRWATPEEITSVSWEEARDELHADMSWQSVSRIGKHLRLLLRFAKDKGAIASVPEIRSPPMELIAAEANQFEPFTRKERDRFLAELRRRKLFRALRCYEVMFFNLFRRSTVQRLMPGWIDWKKHTVRIPPSKAKNSRERTYWLHPRAERAIKQQIKENEHDERGTGITSEGGGRTRRGHGRGRNAGLVSEYRRPEDQAKGVVGSVRSPVFGPFDHYNVFWAALKRLGLVRTRADGSIDRRGLTAHHVARRTAATLLVDAGVSTKDRMAAGGWESIEAAERYDKGEEVERSRRALRRLR